MRAWLFIPAVLVCGCNQAPQQRVPATAPQTLNILDEALAKPKYSNAIVQAQQQLPTDKWEDKPFRRNVSREQRVWAVAKPMLDEITPRLKEMSVSNLVNSFKVVPYPWGVLTNQLGEVEECVYAIGNQLIKNEIKARPREQLLGLQKLGSDKVMLIEGPQGADLSLADELDEILYDLRNSLTNGSSR